MAARNLPIPEAAITHTINVGANFATSPQGIVVGYGDTVNFANNSGSDITIQFLSNSPGTAVYPNMSLPVPNGNPNGPVGFTAPNVDCAANYNILVNGVAQNALPYVIQVGNGPMYVLVTGSIGNADYTPGTVAVPLGNITTGMGKLEIQSQVPNVVFPVAWGNDPFNPGITQSGPAQPVKAGTTPGQYNYSSGPSPHARAGGGTVIIRSS